MAANQLNRPRALLRTFPTPPLTWGGGGIRAIKQRMQSSHIPPCHMHMVIATYGGAWGGADAPPQGAFSHSANYYVVYPGNTPENHPPTEGCMINSKQERGCRVQDPGTRGYRWWKTADVWHSAGTAHSAPP